MKGLMKKIQDPGITDTTCFRQIIRLFNWENGAYCTKFEEILNGYVGPHRSSIQVWLFVQRINLPLNGLLSSFGIC